MGLICRKLWLALLHSVLYFFSLYWLPSSSLSTVFDAISSNVYKVLLTNPSANVLSLKSLRIECSVSACFFKITFFPISFSNAKWMYISLQSLMIELYLHKAKICQTWKINVSYILSSSAKNCWGYTIILTFTYSV